MAAMVVLFVGLAVSAIAIAAMMISLNTMLIRRNSQRLAVLNDIALAGLEEGRSAVNGRPTLMPAVMGYATLAAAAPALDAAGNPIPHVRRSLYAGPSGNTSGQFGVMGSIIAVVEDDFGNRAVRRLVVNQESFAKFAYFTDVEPSNIAFGGGDVIYGPVHSNDEIKIYPSGATFQDEVRTAKTIPDLRYGTFLGGYEEHVPEIPMPTVRQLTDLEAQAEAGGMSFDGSTAGGPGEATVRIEFVAVDLDGDGATTGANEGFIRVYQGFDPTFVVAGRPPGGMHRSRNCGDTLGSHHGEFVSTHDHYYDYAHEYEGWVSSLEDHSAACYLGGDPMLTNGWQASTADGAWLAWPGTVDPRVAAARPDDAAYLWPLSHELNPNFKGVIYVDGKVAISGTVRGRVTVVSPENIVIADDIRQSINVGAQVVCQEGDILGLLSAEDIVVADNTINAQVPGNGSNWITMDPDGDDHEWIDAIVLALDEFRVENYDEGATRGERCEGTNWGRGCLYLAGGIIQRTRGAVGTSAGTGNLKRYSYNPCAGTNPPPYFPTTGRFSRNEVSEIDPTGFDVAEWFADWQSGS